ncbi:MAG TPA: relaxase/mobilization nuclease domain-containing protein [Prosthecobacter sp.]
MVPKITSGGASFKGAFRYYLHDKGAETTERIGWVQTENMRTNDPEKAWKVMAFTAQVQDRLKEASGQSRAGRKLEKPVFAFSLAWHPEQSPTPDHMLATARKAIAALGLTDHESVIVAHKDEPQKHVHVIVNRVHPITGMAGDVRNSKRKLSDFAREYEREDGKIYCQQREENHRQREAGKPTRYSDRAIAEAWETTSTGKEFVAALEARGYRLAQGRKRLVVIDPHGKAHNPSRQLPGVRAADIRARLSDVDLSRLPEADASAQPQKEEPGQEEQEHRAEREDAQSAQQPPGEERQEKDAELEPDQADAEPQASTPTHEEMLAVRLEALAIKHKDQRAALVEQQARRVASSKQKLAQLYDLKAQKDNLHALKLTLQKAPWWKRMLGITRKDRQSFDAQVKTYRKAVSVYRDKLDQIARQNQTARVDLSTRQDKERHELEVVRDTKSLSHIWHVKEQAREHGAEREPGMVARPQPAPEKSRQNFMRSG